MSVLPDTVTVPISPMTSMGAVQAPMTGGMDVSAMESGVLLSIIMLVSAIPLSPGGTVSSPQAPRRVDRRAKESAS